MLFMHMCMSTSGKIACCIIQTFMLHKNACQHQFKLHVAKKSMSTSSKIACCIIQDMHVVHMLRKQACQHESKSHVAKFKTCMLQQAACQHQLKLHVAKKSMSTWIQHACCTIQDMHVALVKTKKIMLPLHVRACQGQRGLFIGTPSVTHTLTMPQVDSCIRLSVLFILFLGESPHHLHTLVRVSPPHIPHM